MCARDIYIYREREIACERERGFKVQGLGFRAQRLRLRVYIIEGESYCETGKLRYREIAREGNDIYYIYGERERESLRNIY